jgi:hypothetical protein
MSLTECGFFKAFILLLLSTRKRDLGLMEIDTIRPACEYKVKLVLSGIKENQDSGFNTGILDFRI